MCKVCANTIRKNKYGIAISARILASMKVLYPYCHKVHSALSYVMRVISTRGCQGVQGILPGTPLETILLSVCLKAY